MAFLEVKDIEFGYKGSGVEVIESISFTGNESEFISIVGPSGCGKSTLLRIMAGLIEPTSGEVILERRRIRSSDERISFVFQDSALLPWLTNIENVKLGLEAMDIDEEEKNKLASNMMHKLELSGFETAYPNVLSGGMKQRVGIARALISNPQMLIMDEPFSSLDELTANSLRHTVLDVLKDKKVLPKSVVMVSHNIEEAVEMSDKIIVLSPKPTRVKKIMYIHLKRPRDRGSSGFRSAVNELYSVFAA